MQGRVRLIGPKEPGAAPTAAMISSSLAISKGLATCGKLAALISFSSWSPRTTSAIKPPSAAFTTKVLTVFSMARSNCSTNWAMVLTSGVSTKRSSSVAARRSVSRGKAIAFSILAA